MAIINGNSFGVYLNNALIGCSTDATLSASRETIDVTCKDNNGARQVLSGSESWTITVPGLWDTSSTTGPSELWAAYKAGINVGVKMSVMNPNNGNVSSGQPYFYGYAKITSFEVGAPQNSGTTYSVTFEGDGELNLATNT